MILLTRILLLFYILSIIEHLLDLGPEIEEQDTINSEIIQNTQKEAQEA